MSHSAGDLARAAVRAFESLEGFEATQTIQAGPIAGKGRVRFRRPDQCVVEYSSYVSPVLDLEERLAHGAEFVADEIVGVTFVHDGHRSMLVDPKGPTCLIKSGRYVAEPLPGFPAIVELSFLETLTQDFLVRDAGEETIDGRPAHLLGLKPKTGYRTQLLRVVSYPIRRAVLALDQESHFPIRIAFHPARGTVLASLVTSSDPVTVSYSAVRPTPPDPAAFALIPPEGARIFREEDLAQERTADQLPFLFSLGPLVERGFHVIGDRIVATLNEQRNRGHVAATLVRESDAGEQDLITVRAGNYLSRVMSRRRSRIAEDGSDRRGVAWQGKILDRAGALPQVSEEEARRAMLDVSWMRDDVFWVLSADGVEESELRDIVENLPSAAEGET